MGSFHAITRAAGLMAALCALAASPLAAQSTINQFPLTSNIPEGIAAGPDGNLWYVVFGDGNPGTSKVGRITTAGAITEFVLPDTSKPIGIVAGPDGAMWFAESAWFLPFSSIGRADPATFPASGSVTHFTTGLAAYANPHGICVGPDNNLWFSERNNNAIGRITTGGVVTEFPIGAPSATPLGIVAGPDGNIWFSDSGTNSSIGVMSTSGSIVKRINIPTVGGHPSGITVGPDGRIWFVEFDGYKVGVMATSATLPADITEYTTPTATPFRIVTGPDGALWFTENGGKIGRITTFGTITETTVLAGPYGIALGPDRAIWFTEGYPSGPPNIGQLLVDCVVTVPTITGGGAQCAGTTLTLTASGGWTFYQWYLNGSAIGGATSATYTKTAATGDTGSYTVNGANGACTSNASAPVSVTVAAQPVATAGGPQTICALGTTTGLGGNTPTGGATGAWSVVSGGTGTFSNASSPSSTFTHTGGTGPVVLAWTISNPPCASSVANVTITTNQPPTAATAGGPQTICTLGTTAGLGGNTPAVGTGTWTVVSGGTGTFSPNATTPNATFTHATGTGPITLRWTISNSPCAPSAANVTLTIQTVTINAASTLCANANATASVPDAGPGTTYAWSVTNGTIVSGQGTPNLVFSAGPSGSVKLDIVQVNSTCTSNGTVTIPISTGCAGPLGFVPVTPCRRIDTRLPADAPQLAAGGQRTFVLTNGPCTIPSAAKSVSVNMTVTQAAAAGDLKLFATGTAIPTATTINFGRNQTRANNAIVALSSDGTGRIDIKNDATGTVDVIIDVNGYFQ